MRFDPKTESELEELDLLAEGEHQFEIVDATEKTSKKGNEMIEVAIDIYDADGRKHRLWDYLVASSAGLCVRKLRHFSACVGVLDSYKAGELNAAWLVGLTGTATVDIQKSERYGSQNVVADYVVPDDYTPAAVEAKAEQTAAEDLEKEIEASKNPSGEEIPF